MNNSWRWVKLTFSIIFILLAVFALSVVVVDPFLHYHAPLKGLSYQFQVDRQRYINDGILRHCDYDALITGTSVCENFRASELSELMGVKSVKVPIRGASFKEVNELTARALAYNPDVRMVVRGLDLTYFFTEKDYMNYENIPTYLYDEDIFNDVNYIFNKDVALQVAETLKRTVKGIKTDDRDSYSFTADQYVYSREKTLENTLLPEPSSIDPRLNSEQAERIEGNIRQNVTELAKAHPEVTFYCFFAPYSICYWEAENMCEGKIELDIESEKLIIETILECDNIRLYSFNDRFDVICNLDNYKDAMHYSPEVNSMILGWIREGRGRLTKDNYTDYLENIRQFYESYDYDSIREPA